MNRHDPIIAADKAEERMATDALRCAQTVDELVSAWWRDCDHFEGEQRERLQEEYRLALRRMGAAAA